MSTFLVECDARHGRPTALSTRPIEASQAICERVFAATLDGHALVSNNRCGATFLDLERDWSHGNHGADRRRPAFGAFLDRIGNAPSRSRTRLRWQGAGAEKDVSAALARYQSDRKPTVKKLVTAARTSADCTNTFRTHERN